MYEGYFKNGVAHGHGLQKQGHFTASVASVYIGEWVNGIKQGYGVMDDIVTGMFLLIYCTHICCTLINMFHYSIQELLKSYLLPKMLNIRICKTVSNSATCFMQV
jgi:hypothetical protein